MSNQISSSAPENKQPSRPNPIIVIGLAFAGLFAGAIGGIIIEAMIGLLTRNIGGLFYFHVAMAALPYLGAIAGAATLPLLYTRR